MWKSPTHETASEKHHRKFRPESETTSSSSDQPDGPDNPDKPDKSQNNNEEPESPSKSNPLSRADSTFMSVCQSLTNNLDLILQGGNFTNILRTTFAPIFLCQKIAKPNCN